MDSGGRALNMGKECGGRRLNSILGTGSMGKRLDMEHRFLRMATSMKESGSIFASMDKDMIFFVMVIHFGATITTASHTDKECTNGQTEMFTKENLSKGLKKEKGAGKRVKLNPENLQ